MERKHFKSVLNAAPVAGDFVLDSTTGFIRIKNLPQFHRSWLQGITSTIFRKDKLPLAEVAKVTEVSLAASIVAAEKYAIKQHIVKQHREGYTLSIPSYKYTAPAVLGAQATEKHNMYVALAAKINQNSSGYATAYPVIDISHAAGNFLVGSTITGATSGATGIVLSETPITTPTVVRIALIGTTLFANGENMTDGTSTLAATSVPTLGVKLRIVDTGNYFGAQGARGGESTWTGIRGFVSTDVTVQSRIASITFNSTATWAIGAIVRGDDTFAAGVLIRVVSSTVALFKLLGETNFAASDTNATDGTTAHNPSAAAFAVATNDMPGLPYLNYSQGQGARLIEYVPVKERISDNYTKGEVDGPTGDAPVTGTEYVQIEWGVNYPGSADPVGAATGGTLPRQFRYFVSLADYSAVDTLLDATGIAN